MKYSAKKRMNFNRFISLCLVFMLIVLLMPCNVLAEETKKLDSVSLSLEHYYEEDYENIYAVWNPLDENQTIGIDFDYVLEVFEDESEEPIETFVIDKTEEVCFLSDLIFGRNNYKEHSYKCSIYVRSNNPGLYKDSDKTYSNVLDFSKDTEDKENNSEEAESEEKSSEEKSSEETDSEEIDSEEINSEEINSEEIGDVEDEDFEDVSGCAQGIKGNGEGGLYIDINAAPYTTYANHAGGSVAYTSVGCTWFVAARVNQLTGKTVPINGANYWYNTQYKNLGFTRGQELRAKAVVCYKGSSNNHVAIIEKVSGDNVLVSEGGISNGSDAAHGHCVIRWKSKYQVEHFGSYQLLGYVYITDDVKNPKIAFDSAAQSGTGMIRVGGWAYDEDNVNQSIAVHVYAYINKDYNTPYFLGETIANVYRPDVNNAFGCGNYHGFDATFPSPVSGTVEVNVAAINIGSGDNVWASGKFINVDMDTQKPVISNVKVSNISSSGYTVTCSVSDNVAIKKVAFPTWTVNGGQDDLPQYWWETSLGTVNNGTATFRVNTSEHNGEKNCTYVTHIYAYDYMGNTTAYGPKCLELYVCDVTQKLSDVKAGQWYTNAVQYLYSRGIMTGNSSGKFCPNAQITRGEFVTILYSMAGKPGATYYSVYDDVKSSAYYAIPVMWATNNGIAAGTGGGRFRPNSNVTREQIAVMLYKYAKLNGCNMTTNSNALNSFLDKGQVSSYATEAMKWAVTQKIISGNGNGKLSPQGSATRAECATMIASFLQTNCR